MLAVPDGYRLMYAGDKVNEEEILFEALTPLGFWVRVTRGYWALIVTVKHPVMADVKRMYGKRWKIRWRFG